MLQTSEFSDNRNLQNLLILTAIKVESLRNSSALLTPECQQRLAQALTQVALESHQSLTQVWTQCHLESHLRVT